MTNTPEITKPLSTRNNDFIQIYKDFKADLIWNFGIVFFMFSVLMIMTIINHNPFNVDNTIMYFSLALIVNISIPIITFVRNICKKLDENK